MTTEIKPHAITRYGLFHLPSASFITNSLDSKRIRLYKSQQKAFKDLHILCNGVKPFIPLENGDSLLTINYHYILNALYKQFDIPKVFTLVKFKNGDKILHLYALIFSIDRVIDSSSITLKDKEYFIQFPERIIIHENRF